jgi:hypothetical protein
MRVNSEAKLPDFIFQLHQLVDTFKSIGFMDSLCAKNGTENVPLFSYGRDINN